MKKTKCVAFDKEAFELHELYKKHEYREISEKNAIKFCPSCGSWAVHLNREAGMKDELNLIPLLPEDLIGGPFRLEKVMRLLGTEQQMSLAKYLQMKGYEKKGVTHRAELKKYLHKEAAV